MIEGKLTTSEAAKRAGIHPVTLQRWIAAGKVRAPKPILVGAIGYRLWTAKDIKSLRKIKSDIYRKGRGRKPKSKPQRSKRDASV
jgi:excisionase family DNA binding protein